MNRVFRTRRLIQGLLGAAIAALVSLAPANGPALDHARAVGLRGAVVPTMSATQVPEWRSAREHIPKAPLEKAARTRRPTAASGSSALPANISVVAVGAPVVFVIRGTTELVALRSECGHCTRAPRPPPIS